MAWAVVNETGKQWNAMKDNIKIRKDHADGLDRKMKNSRSNLMKQKKNTRIFKIKQKRLVRRQMHEHQNVWYCKQIDVTATKRAYNETKVLYNHSLKKFQIRIEH